MVNWEFAKQKTEPRNQNEFKSATQKTRASNRIQKWSHESQRTKRLPRKFKVEHKHKVIEDRCQRRNRKTRETESI